MSGNPGDIPGVLKDNGDVNLHNGQKMENNSPDFSNVVNVNDLSKNAIVMGATHNLGVNMSAPPGFSVQISQGKPTAHDLSDISKSVYAQEDLMNQQRFNMMKNPMIPPGLPMANMNRGGWPFTPHAPFNPNMMQLSPAQQDLTRHVPGGMPGMPFPFPIPPPHFNFMPAAGPAPSVEAPKHVGPVLVGEAPEQEMHLGDGLHEEQMSKRFMRGVALANVKRNPWVLHLNSSAGEMQMLSVEMFEESSPQYEAHPKHREQLRELSKQIKKQPGCFWLKSKSLPSSTGPPGSMITFKDPEHVRRMRERFGLEGDLYIDPRRLCLYVCKDRLCSFKSDDLERARAHLKYHRLLAVPTFTESEAKLVYACSVKSNPTCPVDLHQEYAAQVEQIAAKFSDVDFLHPDQSLAEFFELWWPYQMGLRASNQPWRALDRCLRLVEERASSSHAGRLIAAIAHTLHDPVFAHIAGLKECLQDTEAQLEAALQVQNFPGVQGGHHASKLLALFADRWERDMMKEDEQSRGMPNPQDKMAATWLSTQNDRMNEEKRVSLSRLAAQSNLNAFRAAFQNESAGYSYSRVPVEHEQMTLSKLQNGGIDPYRSMPVMAGYMHDPRDHAPDMRALQEARLRAQNRRQQQMQQHSLNDQLSGPAQVDLDNEENVLDLPKWHPELKIRKGRPPKIAASIQHALERQRRIEEEMEVMRRQHEEEDLVMPPWALRRKRRRVAQPSEDSTLSTSRIVSVDEMHEQAIYNLDSSLFPNDPACPPGTIQKDVFNVIQKLKPNNCQRVRSLPQCLESLLLTNVAEDAKPALELLKAGKNVILRGVKGAGKTTLVKQLSAHLARTLVALKHNHQRVLTVGGSETSVRDTPRASTFLRIGVLHSLKSFPGPLTTVDDHRAAAEFLARLLPTKRFAERRLLPLQLLIVDDVDRVDPVLLSVVDQLLRVLRRYDHPFGGVQLLLTTENFSDDLSQAGPAMSSLVKYLEFPLEFVSLTRSSLPLASNPEVQDLLQGRPLANDPSSAIGQAMLRGAARAPAGPVRSLADLQRHAVELVGDEAVARAANRRMLLSMPQGDGDHEMRTFVATDRMPGYTKTDRLELAAPRYLRLKVHAPVILTIDLDVPPVPVVRGSDQPNPLNSLRIPRGSVGYVVAFEQDSVKVQFPSPAHPVDVSCCEFTCTPEMQPSKEVVVKYPSGEGWVFRRQLPLKLGWFAHADEARTLASDVFVNLNRFTSSRDVGQVIMQVPSFSRVMLAVEPLQTEDDAQGVVERLHRSGEEYFEPYGDIKLLAELTSEAIGEADA